MARMDKEMANAALSKEYKRDSSIEKYIQLRKSNPDNEIEIAVTGGIEHAFKNQKEIAAFGISIEDYLGLLDVDQDCVSRVCLHLLTAITESKRLQANGETHLARRGKAIPGQIIDWLICTMLDSESWNGTLRLNRDLIVLIRQRLMPGLSAFEQLLQVKTQRSNAAMIGGQLIARGCVPSFRHIGKIMDVQASTVKRWFASKEEFDRECVLYAGWFDEKGQVRSLNRK